MSDDDGLRWYVTDAGVLAVNNGDTHKAVAGVDPRYVASLRAALAQRAEPRGCSCCPSGTSRTSMVQRHGTLEAFERACNEAVPGWISAVEADAAVEAYRHQLESAPERESTP